MLFKIPTEIVSDRIYTPSYPGILILHFDRGWHKHERLKNLWGKIENLIQIRTILICQMALPYHLEMEQNTCHLLGLIFSFIKFIKLCPQSWNEDMK